MPVLVTVAANMAAKCSAYATEKSTAPNSSGCSQESIVVDPAPDRIKLFEFRNRNAVLVGGQDRVNPCPGHRVDIGGAALIERLGGFLPKSSNNLFQCGGDLSVLFAELYALGPRGGSYEGDLQTKLL